MQSRKLRLLSLLSIGLVSLGTVGCTDTSSSTGSGHGGGASTIHEETSPSDLNIYFYPDSTDGGTYDTRNWVWAWNDDNSWGFEVSGDELVTVDEIGEKFGFVPVYITLDNDYDVYVDNWSFSSTGTANWSSDLSNIFTGVIFRTQDGSSQTEDFDLDPSQFKLDENGNYNIYIYENRGVYYDAADFPTSPITGASFTYNKDQPAVLFKGTDLKNILSTAIDEGQLYLRPYRYDESGSKVYASENIGFTKLGTGNNASLHALLDTSESLDLTYKYEVFCRNSTSGEVESAGDLNMRLFYSSDEFDALYHTDKTLGATVETEEDTSTTTFRLWSPTATKVVLNTYGADTSSLVKNTYEMTKDDNGVWEYSFNENLHGTYYTFDVTNYGQTTTDVPDPYAYSSDANGVHSMVVDWDSEQLATPAESTGWAPEVNANATTIMEMHTGDLTNGESWNGTEDNAGKYAGLHETGTTIETTSGSTISTGFDYIKGLHDKGLTHIQLQPAYDFQSVDETRLDDEDYQNQAFGGAYNWGYDPQQYNAPEGSYSSDPTDGNVRVKEFQEFVADYNSAGIGVVMDVVYNHMPSQSGSSFESVFPGYYFRTSSYSGAGTDIASQRSMVRDFIVDSVTSWATHYHVSGFRFDLMGILDLETMKAVRQALDEIDPNIIVYGEGWTQFTGDSDSGLDAEDDMATQTNLNKLGEDWVGAFNDTYRDGMKGSVFDSSSKGYVQQAIEGTAISSATKDNVYYGMTGTYYLGSTGSYSYVTSAEDGIGASITYVECHDNATLHDTLILSSADTELVPEEIQLANASVLGSLAPAFFQIGQDFGRSKEVAVDSDLYDPNTCYTDPNDPSIAYSHNSYNTNASVNAIDWTLLDTNSELVESFNANLEARKERATKLTTDATHAQINSTDTFQTNLVDNDRVISFKYTQGGVTYIFIQNYSDEAITYEGQNIAAHSTYTTTA